VQTHTHYPFYSNHYWLALSLVGANSYLLSVFAPTIIDLLSL
jgi:hypothetical protein